MRPDDRRRKMGQIVSMRGRKVDAAGDASFHEHVI